MNENTKKILDKEGFLIEFDTTTTCETFAGKSKAGNDYSITKQAGYFHTPNDQYPTKVGIILDSDKAADMHPVGFYIMNNPVTVGAFDSLAINNKLTLEPVKQV